jgi:hypothetical protein
MRHGYPCAALLLLLAGCAVRQPVPPTWRYGERVLAPPGVATADQASSTFQLKLPGRGPCEGNDAVTLVRRKARVTVTVNRDALLQQKQGWLAAWAAGAEAQGCIPAGSGVGLAKRILESLPLPPNAPLRLLRADKSPDYVEIGAGMRLQVVSPILRDGAAPDGSAGDITNITGQDHSINVELRGNPDLIGFETAWYDVRRKPSGTGVEIVPVSAETTIGGKVEAQAAPHTNYFQFAPEMGFFRLFYKADQSEVLAMAPTRAALPTDADRCAACYAIPHKVGINPYLRISANGAPLPLGIGGTLFGLLHNAKIQPESVLPTLTILKPWRGTLTPVLFDRKNPQILQLVLTGDEVIRW